MELDYLQSRSDRDEIFLLGFWLCDLIMSVKGVIAVIELIFPAEHVERLLLNSAFQRE